MFFYSTDQLCLISRRRKIEFVRVYTVVVNVTALLVVGMFSGAEGVDEYSRMFVYLETVRAIR
jgi:hypothetical protein